MKARGKSDEYVGGDSYSGGEAGREDENSCCDAAVTVTVGDRSIHEAGMLIGVSDGLERLQQHSERRNHLRKIDTLNARQNTWT